MLRLKDIEDALMNDIRESITGVKTVAVHEAEWDDSQLTNLMPKTPFVLVRYGGTSPVESERRADDSASLEGREFHLSIGAESLRSKKEAQRGCYDIIDDLRERYNGFDLAVGDEMIHLVYDGDSHRFSGGRLVLYSVFLKWNEN